ncbi:MAG: helix-turn-helix domain-containing protein [Patescibacteria group bacterium]
MISFTAKKIKDTQTIAEILTQSRKEKNFDLAKVEKETKINKKYLLALENGEYQKLPSAVYIQNFIKSYARYLGLNTEQILQILGQELEIFSKIKEGKEKSNQEKVKPTKILITPKSLQRLAAIVLIVACLAYLGWEINKIFLPPELNIETPTPDLVTSEKSVIVRGTTDSGVRITINSQEILADQNGQFEKEIDLQAGLNTIQISAKKRLSRSQIVTRQILVPENKPLEIIEGQAPTNQ